MIPMSTLLCPVQDGLEKSTRLAERGQRAIWAKNAAMRAHERWHDPVTGVDGGTSNGGKMARPERFELPAFWFVARRSIQLS